MSDSEKKIQTMKASTKDLKCQRLYLYDCGAENL